MGWNVVLSYLKYLEITSNKYIFFKWFQRATLHLYISLIPKGNALTFMYTYSFSICYMIELCMYMDHCLLEVALSFPQKKSPYLATTAQHINMTSITYAIQVLELICLNKPFLKLFWGRGKQMTKFIVERKQPHNNPIKRGERGKRERP